MLQRKWLLWTPLLALSLAACRVETNKRSEEGEHDRQSDALLLRTYDVPGEYSAEVGGMIRHLLKPDPAKPAIGSASVGPGGRLLVAAPKGIQEGVEDLVDALREKQPPPPATVTIEVWLVAGRRTEQAGDLKVLGEAAPAIEEVMKQEGPMEIELIEKLSLSSISAQHAETFGADVKLGQVATVINDRVLADLDIDPAGPNQYKARVELTNGRMLVLGQSGYVPGNKNMPFASDDGRAAKGVSLFYIVRAKATSRGTGL